MSPVGLADPRPPDAVATLLADGRVALDGGALAEADAAVERALALLGPAGDPAQRIRTLTLAAQSALAAGDVQRATVHATAAVAAARAVGGALHLANSLLVLARVGYHVGDFEQALDELEVVRPLLAQIDDDATSFAFHVFVANVHLSLCQHEAAIGAGTIADALARRSGDRRSEAVAAGNLASYLLSDELARTRRGEPFDRAALERALAHGERAIRAADACGAHRLNLSHLSTEGAVLVELDRPADALAAFARHRALATSLGQFASMPAALLAEARLMRRTGRSDVAGRLLAESIEIGERLQLDGEMPDLYELASTVAEEAGDLAEALRLYKAMYRTRTRSVTLAAEQRSLVMAVRLANDRAVRTAATERKRAEELQDANRVLERHAEKLTRETLEDALTGLANRRRLDAHLARCHFDATAGSTRICVAVLDVDFFKQVNDRHSHAIGDQVLRTIADLMRRHCRAEDLPARTGGEEFVVSFHDVGLTRATAACERIRSEIERFDWASIAPGLAVTISIGVTELGRHSRLVDALAAADALLYAAKHGGRNRVHSDRALAA